MIHPEGTESEEPTSIGVVCSGPTGLYSTEEPTPIGVACSGPTGLEEKKNEGPLPEGWKQQDGAEVLWMWMVK